MNLSHETVIGTFVGKPESVGASQKLTAMMKKPVAALKIYKDHIEGDEVADKKHHGGLDRVVHHYSIHNFNHLKEKFPEISDTFIPGSYGENFTTNHLSEADLCIGDIFNVGTATLQISEPRFPCGTIDYCYNFRGVLKEILQSGKYGWFYRVLEAGEIKIGDDLVLKDRPCPEIRLDKLIKLARKHTSTEETEFLKMSANCPELSANWRSRLQRSLRG